MTTILLFIFAFLVRLINLNQSLWLDEAVVAKVVRSIPFFQIPIQFSPADFHPPLYYLFMSLWTTVFGSSEIALRMPSIIFSLIAGLFVYKIGALIKDKTVGFWAAAFFLFNPLIIYYSQEARMYMMATMFLTGSLFYFLKHANYKNGKFVDWISPQARTSPASAGMTIAFNIFSALAMFTFYGSAFFIAGMIVAFFVIPTKVGIQKGLLYRFRIKSGMTATLSFGLLISLVILSPLLLQQLQTAKTGLLEVKNWSLVLGKAELKNVLMIFIKFTSGRLSWYPKASYYLVVGSWSLVVGLLLLLGMKKNRLFAYLFILPLVFGLCISFWAPMMMYFRFLYLIPVMSVLLAIAVIPTKVGIQKGLLYRFRIKSGMTIIFLIFSLVYLLLPQFHREDWKKMVSHMSPTEPVYMILPSSDPVGYYNPNLSLDEMRDLNKRVLPEYIQVVPYVEEIYGYNHTAELEKKGCTLEERSVYRGPLILERWKCLRNA